MALIVGCEWVDYQEWKGAWGGFMAPHKGHGLGQEIDTKLRSKLVNIS